MWDDVIVRAVHSRVIGVRADPLCGCTNHALSKRAFPTSLGRGHFLLSDAGDSYEHNAAPPKCRTCDRCVQYEESIAHKFHHNRRGRRRSSRDLLSEFTIAGVQAPASLTHRESVPYTVPETDSLFSFSVLAPPVGMDPRKPFDLSALVFNSAARLHFSVTSLQRLLQRRLKKVLGLQGNSEVTDHTHDKEMWYLAPPEFEHLLLISGVNWMTHAQIKTAYTALDTNGSGQLHAIELSDACEAAEEDCLRILRREVEPEWVAKKIMQSKAGGALKVILTDMFREFEETGEVAVEVHASPEGKSLDLRRGFASETFA